MTYRYPEPSHHLTAQMFKTFKTFRRVIVGIAGFTVLLVGIALIVLPGPAFLVIPLGLGILATEFVWARNLLKKVKERFMKQKEGPQ